MMALLLMLDVSMGLLGRLNSQLQLTTLAFPLKITAVLGLLAWAVLLFPRSVASYTELAFSMVQKLTGP
jgi:flagellar biosynthesis protein FliR